jgi:hypothetical protein
VAAEVVVRQESREVADGITRRRGPAGGGAPGPAWSTADHAIGEAMPRARPILHERNIWADSDSIIVVADRFDDLRDREAELAEFEPERPAGNPEDSSRLELVAPGRSKYQRQEMLVDLGMDVLVEVFLAFLHPSEED